MKKLIKKFFFNKTDEPNKYSINRDKYLNIGENVRFMGENILDKVNPQLVFIGNHCVVGYRSSILTHCPIGGPSTAKIGDYVWLGFDVTVMPGSQIANNTVVGGGSVVTKKFPENVIIAGNPARIIRELTEEEIASLQYRLKNRLPMGKEGE